MSKFVKQLIPEFIDLGKNLRSHICIWCGDSGPLTKSHLIPQALGGWFKPIVSCETCNNYLGWKFESELDNNLYIASARVCLGLAKRKDAYRRAKKRDKSKGISIRFDDKGNIEPAYGQIDDRTYTGPLEDTIKYWRKWFERKRPNWPFDEMESFLRDPNRRILRYACETFKKDIHINERARVDLELPRDPSPKLIFKIIYEYVALHGLLQNRQIASFLSNFIKIDREDPENRIILDRSLNKYIFSNTAVDFRGESDIENLPYKKYHYLVIRISENLVLYFELVLFGIIRCILVMGPISPDDRLLGLYDRCYVFPIFDKSPSIEFYKNVNWKMNYIWGNISAEIRLKEIEG